MRQTQTLRDAARWHLTNPETRSCYNAGDARFESVLARYGDLRASYVTASAYRAIDSYG